MTFRDSTFLHRFFAIGSGTAAGVYNITVVNCTLGAPEGVGHYGPNCDAGINIKVMRKPHSRQTSFLFTVQSSRKSVHCCEERARQLPFPDCTLFYISSRRTCVWVWGGFTL
jgi:hypothetical protein